MHGFLFMSETNPHTAPYHWPGKIATIKLIRALHATPKPANCPLIDAKYAAEHPEEALTYFFRNHTLEGAFDEGSCLTLIKRQCNTIGTVTTLNTILLGAVMNNDVNLIALTAKAIRKYGADYCI